MKSHFKILACIVLLSALAPSCTSEIESSDNQEYINEINAYRNEIDSAFRYSIKSPFNKKKNFDKLNFYSPDIRFKVKASKSEVINPKTVQFETNTDRRPVYLKKYLFHFDISGSGDSLWGYVQKDYPNSIFVPFKDLTNTDRRPVYLKKYLFHFDISGSGDSLWGYVQKDYPNSIFVPFKDLTNNNTTYAGGRYLDITDIALDSIWIDFNLAYNPYCHYDTGYSCPVIPAENRLHFMVEAGEKIYK